MYIIHINIVTIIKYLSDDKYISIYKCIISYNTSIMCTKDTIYKIRNHTFLATQPLCATTNFA